MPINTSRYRRTVEWDGPKKPARKPVFDDGSGWRRKFYILLIAAVAVVLVLGSVLGWVLWKNRSSKPATNSTDTSTDTSEVSSWTKSENASVGITFLYPPDWKLTQNKTQSDLDILNVSIAGTGSAGATATVKVDVIKDASNLSLVDWVKQFGPKDIQTASSRVAGETALLAQFSNAETGEEQNVYYVLKNNNVYVFDLYQSAKDTKLQQQLKDFSNNITFTTASTTQPTTETPTTPATTTTQKLLVNTVASSFNDEFSTYAADGTGKTLLFSDKDAPVYLKGNAEVFSKNGANTLVGYFGKSGSTSKDGVYSIPLNSDAGLQEVVSGVTPGLVRVSRDGSTIGYLDGAKGTSKKIVLVSATGDKIATITTPKAVQYFALSSDGKQVAYVTITSAAIVIASQSGATARTLEGFVTANIYSFDWITVEGAGDAITFVSDGTRYTNKAELYYIDGFDSNGKTSAKIKRLSADSVAQDSPRFNSNATKIAYQSYTSGTSGKSSIWVIGPDAKNDTSIAKSANNLLVGWISE